MLSCSVRLCVFFFQAEDGIRDADVTGVQTCALPISDARNLHRPAQSRSCRCRLRASAGVRLEHAVILGRPRTGRLADARRTEIGRGSCRERGEISVVAVSFKKKKKIKSMRGGTDTER